MSLQDRITKLCLNKYRSLKKTGKPTESEWTVLSGIVLENTSKKLTVISLCTGTKCLGGPELLNTNSHDHGYRLSDSHAEILVRRAFLRYLYYQIEILYNKMESDIFYLDESSIKLKDVSFHFFSSQTPCGDCSIIPKLEIANETNDYHNPLKKMKKEVINDNQLEFEMKFGDIYRTGAKCLENGEKRDSHGKGIFYHTVGLLRTKPGRGEKTLSLSCSDKIARWLVMGIQGALLSLMIPSIYFKSIIIGGDCPYSLESMRRGLYERFNTELKLPEIMQSTYSFEHKKSGLRIRSCPSSIVWCNVPVKPIEIAVDGLKQGATKKIKKSCSLLISRKEIFKTFLKVYEKYSCGKLIPQHPKKIVYYDCKQYSFSYQNLWKDSSKNFSPWPTKPFCLQQCLSF